MLGSQGDTPRQVHPVAPYIKTERKEYQGVAIVYVWPNHGRAFYPFTIQPSPAQ